MEQILRLIAGVVVLAGLLLAWLHDPRWLWLTGLLGASLVQSGFTGW